MLNQAKSSRNAVHSARGIAVVNGMEVRFIQFNCEHSGFSEADSFNVKLPFFITSKNIPEKILANGPDFQTDLLTKDSIPVELYVGFPKSSKFTKNDLTLVMTGFVDTVDWEFSSNGEFVTIEGRNIVGKMIDNKLVDKFPNLTASGIANTFASKYGLKTKITATTTLSGKYYNNESIVMPTTEMTEWDLLCFLAKQENFIVRVKGDTLCFGPYSVVTGYVNQTPIIYTWGADIDYLTIQRSPHGSKNIIVKVVSYNAAGKKRIVETVKSKSGTKNSEDYVETYIIPGLTRDQAQKKARSIYEELSRSQIIGQLTCVGNFDMDVDRLLNIAGLGVGLSDKNYYLNRVNHMYSVDDGYYTDSSFSNQFMADEEGVPT